MKFLLSCLITITLLLGGAARAQDSPEVDATLDAARQQVDQIKARLSEKLGDAELADTRLKLLALQQRADKIALEQKPLFDSAQARLSELGPVAAGSSEAADVAEQRRMLKKSNEQLDARLKLARLLALESEQLSDEIGGQRRARFRAELFARTDSILSPAFWRDLRSGASRDGSRLDAFQLRLAQAAAGTTGLHWLGLLALVLAAAGLRVWLGRWLTELTSERAPPGRVRRSLHAVAQSLLMMLVPGVATYALTRGLFGNLAETDPLQALAASCVGVVCFAAYIAGLGQALLAPRHPSWRLPPLPDAVASGLRWYPALLGVLTFAGWFLLRLAGAVPLSLAVEVTINAVQALVLGGVLVHLVHRGERLRQQDEADEATPTQARRPGWLTLALVGVWGLLLISQLVILVGYVALGSFIVRQVIWAGVLLLTTYLLSLLIDDVFSAWLSGQTRLDQTASESTVPTRGQTLRNQVVVLGSGVLRLTLWLVAVVMILAPFGESPGDLLTRTDQLRVGVAVGELQLRPTIVLQALLIFLLAQAALRVLKRWLSDSFLPTTALDEGMRSSVTTLFSFVGMVLAIGVGLSALGVALDKVAWIASALSVGIGFGLQAVVSNFVSGLIMLAERPVKVGDWVTLGGPGGGIEGDIRRINVRATEIQMSDRSTLIVPNSEFITKIVRNVTHDNPVGLVQIKLPMPLDCDTAQVSEILLRAFAEHDDVMDTPAPKVQLDGIDRGSIVFNITGYVSSPRQAYGVRSALLFRVLQDIRAAGLPMRDAPSLVLRELPPDSV